MTASCKLHRLHDHHPDIRAEDWRSPLVYRLCGDRVYTDGQVSISDSFRDFSQRITSSTLDLEWTELQDDYARCINTYQEAVLTEFATLGLACILLTERCRLQITEVTLRGDKADYWVGDREHLLEVSGQQKGNLEALREDKANQLLDNPFGLPGFVCVANYSEKKAYLWAYEESGR